MSEKYFNAYVDAAVGSIHEYVASTLQLKAQLRVANEIIVEKDRAIAERDEAITNIQQNVVVQLQNEINALRYQSSETETLKANAKQWEDSYHGIINKVSHMETLSKQYNDLKKQFLAKCEELEQVQRKLDELENPNKSPKKVINSKNSNSTIKQVAVAVQSKSKETDVDDF